MANEIITTQKLEGDDGMPTIYFLKGIPASGKSTWAKEFMAKNPDTIRINKDDLRSMLGQPYSKTLENVVSESSKAIGAIAVFNGYDIIVDDTNFNPEHEEYWHELAYEYAHKFTVVFLNTQLKECLARNKKRETKIPEQDIRNMYNKYVKDKNV